MYARSQATSLAGESLADSAKPPAHLKSFDTITAPITTLAFNPDGQILLAASKDKRDCLKLVRARLDAPHRPGLTPTLFVCSTTPRA
jgi:WD40 repeat protein